MHSATEVAHTGTFGINYKKGVCYLNWNLHYTDTTIDNHVKCSASSFITTAHLLPLPLGFPRKYVLAL